MSRLRVLVGRREGADADLVTLLHAAGFAPVWVPLIAIAEPSDSEPLRQAVTRLASGGFDWVAFTSVPAVEAVLAVAGSLGVAVPIPGGTAVAAVGPATAGALARAGIGVDLVPSATGSAAALAQAWPIGQGESVLLPRSELAALGLPEGLRDKGYDPVEVVAYRTIAAAVPPAVAADLAGGSFAAVVLGSGSAARSLARFPIGAGTAVVAIGESTAREATAAGLSIAAVAERPSAQSLVATVRHALRRTGGPAAQVTGQTTDDAVAHRADCPGAVPSTPGRPASAP